MRSRSWVPVLGWCAATLTSVGLAWVAMTPVLRTATAEEGTLVSVDQLRDTGDLPPPAPSAPAPAPAPSTAAAERRGKSPAPSSTPRKSRSPSRTVTSPASSPSATTPAPKPSSPATTTTEDGWTVTTGGDGARTYVRSFQVEGGRTVIRAANGVIKLVTATPADGYAVATVQDTADNLAVYFNEVNHSFIVHVVWQAGEPVDQVSEVGS